MPLPNHLTSEEAHDAGTESTKGFMRFGTLEEHISKASNVAVQPKYVEDVVFPLRGSITKGTSLALTAQEDGTFKWQPVGSGEPVGKISWMPALTPPTGYLALSNDNGLLIRSGFEALWAEAQRSGLLRTEAEWQAEFAAHGSVGFYSSGDGSTTFRVPLLRKVFLRCADPDSGLDVGTYQGDASRRLVASLPIVSSGTQPAVSGAISWQPLPSKQGLTVSNQGPGGTFVVDSELTLPTAEENRPVDIVLLPVMKAFDTIIPPSDLILADAFQQLVEINNKVSSEAHIRRLAGTKNGKILAWASFSGGTPPVIKAGGNIASIVRTAEGTYTLNFTTALQSVNYAVAGSAFTSSTYPLYIWVKSYGTGNLVLSTHTAHATNIAPVASDVTGTANIIIVGE